MLLQCAPVFLCHSNKRSCQYRNNVSRLHQSPFSTAHWSRITSILTDTESQGPCGRIGSQIFVTAISSNHWLLSTELQICQSYCHPHLKASHLFSWDLAMHWKIPCVLQMNAAVTPNAKMSCGCRSESLSEFII